MRKSQTIASLPWIRQIALERAASLKDFFRGCYGTHWRARVSQATGLNYDSLFEPMHVLDAEAFARRRGWSPAPAVPNERNWFERLNFFLVTLERSPGLKGTVGDAVAELLHSPAHLRLRDDIEADSLRFSDEFTSMRNTCKQHSAALDRALATRLEHPPPPPPPTKKGFVLRAVQYNLAGSKEGTDLSHTIL